MTNIVSEGRSANIVRDHAMILPDDATPKPDGIFGKDRSEKQIVRPSATARHQLPGEHINSIDVGPLLAVDLDADKPLVHQFCNLRIRVDRSLGNVAPVAGAVADREEDRFVL